MIGANFSNWYNQTEGSFYVEGSTALTSEPGFLTVQNAGLTDFLRMTRGFSQARTLVLVNNASQADISSGAVLALNSTVKIASAYQINSFAQALNGGTVVTDLSGSVPVATSLVIGAGGFANPLNGHIRRIAYYPRRLANTELQGITS
jgi:hypothetical protein